MTTEATRPVAWSPFGAKHSAAAAVGARPVAHACTSAAAAATAAPHMSLKRKATDDFDEADLHIYQGPFPGLERASRMGVVSTTAATASPMAAAAASALPLAPAGATRTARGLAMHPIPPRSPATRPVTQPGQSRLCPLPWSDAQLVAEAEVDAEATALQQQVLFAEVERHAADAREERMQLAITVASHQSMLHVAAIDALEAAAVPYGSVRATAAAAAAAAAAVAPPKPARPIPAAAVESPEVHCPTTTTINGVVRFCLLLLFL